jgi:hypothetical protein
MDEQSNAQWKGRIRTTEADSLFGEEHVRRYRETDGDVDHIWQGSTVLLLTTKGRKSGEPRTTPLAYDRVGDDFLVLASNGARPSIRLVSKPHQGAAGRGASEQRGLPRPGSDHDGR